MTVTDTSVVHENKTPTTYRDPAVEAFYGTVIQALEDGPDGASSATVITGAFHRQHQAHVQREHALTSDVRRLSADDTTKAAMLSYASRSTSRLMDECVRLAGRLHAHQDVESRVHDLAGQLDETHPGIAEQLRDALMSIAAPAPPAHGPTILAFVPDPRWRTGWFRRSDRPEGALEPLPFAGWAMVASVPETPAQAVEAAFLSGGTWMTKSEFLVRGMTLVRVD